MRLSWFDLAIWYGSIAGNFSVACLTWRRAGILRALSAFLWCSVACSLAGVAAMHFVGMTAYFWEYVATSVITTGFELLVLRELTRSFVEFRLGTRYIVSAAALGAVLCAHSMRAALAGVHGWKSQVYLCADHLTGYATCGAFGLVATAAILQGLYWSPVAVRVYLGMAISLSSSFLSEQIQALLHGSDITWIQYVPAFFYVVPLCLWAVAAFVKTQPAYDAATVSRLRAAVTPMKAARDPEENLS